MRCSPKEYVSVSVFVSLCLRAVECNGLAADRLVANKQRSCSAAVERVCER